MPEKFVHIHALAHKTATSQRLCYSPSHTVFCFACKHMTHVSVFGKQGYRDWKRASQAIPNHEKSSAHREDMVQLLQRSDRNSRVDAELVGQANTKHDY